MPSLICAARWMNVSVVNKSSIDRSIDHPFLPYTFTPSRFSHRERDAQGFHALPLLLTQVPKGDRSARPPHPPRTRRGGWRRRSGRRARGPKGGWGRQTLEVLALGSAPRSHSSCTVEVRPFSAAELVLGCFEVKFCK